ncbi:MAG: superfamily I DNA and RNA helicase [Gammaproteobacteria bacterium]|jgi:superfamily I DNA and RNA helicase
MRWQRRAVERQYRITVEFKVQILITKELVGIFHNRRPETRILVTCFMRLILCLRYKKVSGFVAQRPQVQFLSGHSHRLLVWRMEQ